MSSRAPLARAGAVRAGQPGRDHVDNIEPGEADRAVRVFTIAYAEGDDEMRKVLADIAGTTRARAYHAENPEQIDDVILDVVSNF